MSDLDFESHVGKPVVPKKGGTPITLLQEAADKGRLGGLPEKSSLTDAFRAAVDPVVDATTGKTRKQVEGIFVSPEDDDK